MKLKFLLTLLLLGCIEGSILRARAYTAIAVSGPAPGRIQRGGDHFGYFHSDTQPRQIVEQRALALCRQSNGVDPKLVISTDGKGFFAIAMSGDGRTVGWSGPLPTMQAADEEAIAQCKKRGGYGATIKAHWADH